MTEAKPFTISKELVYQAWRSVKANKGAAGIDGQSLSDFETNLGKNLCFMKTPTATDLADQRIRRWRWLENVAGDEIGSLIWISKDFSIIWIINSSCRQWNTTSGSLGYG
jgi:hypothetical protein